MKTMIIYDSLFVRMKIRDMLDDHTNDIVEAESGDAALPLFYQKNPELVFLDILMADGNKSGIRVLKEIKKTNPETIVVMVSSLGKNSIINECKNAGANDYIVKPIEEAEFKKVAEKYLAPKSS
jgi:two-component system chemotaxis response regulator CheY